MIFRYPGSKTKLLPELRPHIDYIMRGQKEFYDVFVGGGSVLIDTAKRHPNSRLFANDSDPYISSFWSIISSGKVNNLCKMIDTKPTIDMFFSLREKTPASTDEFAFYAVFFNRTTFSGIFSSGPIGGKTQASEYKVDCRYNAKKLISEIRLLSLIMKNRLVVSNLDAVDLVASNNAPMYLDPPYYEKGNSLYNKRIDHPRLSLALKDKTLWALSYDDNPRIRDLYNWASIQSISAHYGINGPGNEWKRISELVISPKHQEVDLWTLNIL